MSFNVGAIEGTLELNRNPFQRSLAEARVEAQNFERDPLRATLELATTTARAKLEEFKGLASRLEPKAVLDIRIASAEAQVKAFEARLAELAAKKPSPTVELQSARAQEKLDLLKLRLEQLRAMRVEVTVDIDRSASSRIESFFGKLRAEESHLNGLLNLFGKAGSGVGSIPFIGGLASLPFKGVEALLSGLDKLPGLLGQVGQAALSAFQTVQSTVQGLLNGTTTVGQVLGSLVSGLVSVVATGGTALIAFGALAAVFGAFASVVVSLVAALAALAASLAAAAAGAVALFIGGFAAAVPVIGVLVAFMTRLVAVVQAHKAAQQAAQQAVQQHTQAVHAQHQALATLNQAQENLKAQTVAAWEAMRRSAVDYQHALLGVEQSRLGIEGARLSLRQAKQDLKDFLHQAAGADFSKLFQAFTNVDFNPESARKIFAGATGKNVSGDQLLQLQEKLFAVKQATLGVKTANQSYQDSVDQLTKAEQKRNDFLQQGIEAYAPYRQAIDQVAQAQDRYAQATKRVSSAQIAYEQKLKQLSSTEQGFLGTLTQIERTFSSIAKAVAAPIFQGIERGFTSIQKLVTDPMIQRGLVGIGNAIGHVISGFAKDLTTKPWRDAIKQFLDAGAQLTRSGGRLFIGFLTVLREIAQAALPHVISGVKSLAGWFTDLGKRPGAIKNAVEFLVHQFRAWWDVAKALGGLVVAFIRDAAGAGGRLAEHLASILRHWTAWLNKNPDAVKRFFDHSVTQTSHILDNLGKIIEAMVKMIDLSNKVADWVGNARRNAEHAVFGTGGISAAAMAKDTAAAEADIRLLQNPNTSAERRAEAEQRLRENLDYLSKHWAHLSPELDTIRKQLDSGGHPFAPRRVQPRRSGKPPRAGTSELHFHAHGIQDPQHFLSTAAPKVARHPDFKKARIGEARRRGK